MRTAIISNYTFDKANKTVTFTDFTAVDVSRIISITDVTNGVQIYSYRLAGFLGTVLTNVLTLSYDTNSDRFSDSDKLLIEYALENTSVVISPSAAHTESFNSAVQTNYDHRGVAIIINVTAVTGTETPTMVAKLQVRDELSLNFIDIPGAVTASITATGQTLLTIYPGLTASANSKVDYPLPRTYRVVYTITGTTPSFTFSTTAHYLN